MIDGHAQSVPPMAYANRETHIDERTVPTNKAPRVLSTGINAGIAEKSQRDRLEGDRNEGNGGGSTVGVGQFPIL